MFCLLAILLFASAVRDKIVEKRIHPVSLWGALAILASFPVRIAIAHTPLWHSFATWLVR
jgi:hypothetical protein